MLLHPPCGQRKKSIISLFSACSDQKLNQMADVVIQMDRGRVIRRMKEKEKKKDFCSRIVLIFIVVYAVRVIAVNSSYKRRYTVQKGESIEVQGNTILLESEMKKCQRKRNGMS